MINFTIKKVDNFYNLTFMKKVHKRTGEIVEEPGSTLYGISLDVVKNRLAHENTVAYFENENVSLKDYLTEFYKSYNEICKLLKKTL